jgi:hypothetical protein
METILHKFKIKPNLKVKSKLNVKIKLKLNLSQI